VDELHHLFDLQDHSLNENSIYSGKASGLSLKTYSSGKSCSRYFSSDPSDCSKYS